MSDADHLPRRGEMTPQEAFRATADEYESRISEDPWNEETYREIARNLRAAADALDEDGRQYGACWVCRRERLPRSALTFVEVEDDGCGEWECRDRRGCYEAAQEARQDG
jgi:hypothetical protein